MARRIVLGQVGSAFRFRVAEPGVDAATADLDQLIFDADNIPTRILATGTTTVDLAPNPGTPNVRELSHGVSPSLMIGVAQSIWTSGGEVNETNEWLVRTLTTGNSLGRFVLFDMAAKDGWSTPWYWFGNEPDQSQSCGWRLGWDASKVYVYNHSGASIRVRWTALDF
jgi:hypothetical protein